MAKRPIYIPQDSFPFVSDKLIEFTWHAGFSVSQKQKSIQELHFAAQALNFTTENGKPVDFKLLEVSSKSKDPLGVALSAFNLKFTENKNGKIFSVENIFQSAKVFENGGPFTDLRSVSPVEAKRDPRLKESGALKYFQYDRVKWQLEPKTYFYDWIYINALHQNKVLAEQVKAFNAFTDIEFNPKKSINCQARSVALYVALDKAGLLEQVIGLGEANIKAYKKKLKLDKKKLDKETEPKQGCLF